MAYPVATKAFPYPSMTAAMCRDVGGGGGGGGASHPPTSPCPTLSAAHEAPTYLHSALHSADVSKSRSKRPSIGLSE